MIFGPSHVWWHHFAMCPVLFEPRMTWPWQRVVSHQGGFYSAIMSKSLILGYHQIKHQSSAEIKSTNLPLRPPGLVRIWQPHGCCGDFQIELKDRLPVVNKAEKRSRIMKVGWRGKLSEKSKGWKEEVSDANRTGWRRSIGWTDWIWWQGQIQSIGWKGLNRIERLVGIREDG